MGLFELVKMVFKPSTRLTANQRLGLIIYWRGSLRAIRMEILDLMDCISYPNSDCGI